MLRKYLHIKLQADQQKLQTLQTKILPLRKAYKSTNKEDRGIISFEHSKSSPIDRYLHQDQYKKHRSISLNKKIKLQLKHVHIVQPNSLGTGNFKFRKKPDIFKLPIKLEKMKKKIESNHQEIVSRPSRHFYNCTEIGKLQKKMQQKQLYSKNKKKNRNYRKINSFKKMTALSQQSGNQQVERENDWNEQQKEQEMPNNFKLVMKQLKFVQSKVVKVNYVDQLKQIMGKRQSIKKNSEVVDESKAKIQQQKKQQQIQLTLQPPQPSKLQQKNPLKQLISYSFPSLYQLHSKLTQILQLSMKKPSIKIFMLPNQQEMYSFIKKYKPLCQLINVEYLLMSPAFEIQTSFSDQNGIQSMNEKYFYFGEKKNGKFQGYGILISELETKEGIWEAGVIIKGIISNQIGVYNGQMNQYGKSGTGQFKYSSGCTYQGTWLQDKRNGSGYFKFSSTQSYLGDWKDGLLQGKGVLKTRLSVYEGQFKNSLRSGQGKQKFKNQDSFQGSFEKNMPSGKGIYIWKTGTTFEGQFCKGVRQGFGILNAPSIVKYEGNFKNDLPSGTGKAIYNNGDEYHGLFYQGERNGRGDLVCSNKKQFYTGDWMNDTLVHELD